MGIDIVVGFVYIQSNIQQGCIRHMGVLLQRRDYEKILSLVRSLNPAEGPRDIREAITLTLMEMFCAYGGIFFLGEPNSGRLIPTGAVLVNLDNNYYDQYVQHYWRLDPVYAAISSSSMGAFRFSDTRSSCRCPKDEFYSDFLRPQGIGAELVLCFQLDNKLSASVSLFRSTHDTDFGYQDVRKANVVSSYMSTIFHNATLLSQLHEERGRFQNMFESMEEGIIVLDNELKVIYCNSKALEVSHLWSKKLHRNNYQENKSLVVPDKILEDCLALKTRFEIADSMVGVVSRRIACVNETDCFRVDSKIFTNAFESMRKAYFLISISGPSKIAAISEGWVRKEYNLTKRELEVIHYLSQGLTNQQIADKLFLSLFTVITHLKNIYQKVGVQNRTELVFHLQHALDRRKSKRFRLEGKGC